MLVLVVALAAGLDEVDVCGAVLTGTVDLLVFVSDPIRGIYCRVGKVLHGSAS